MLIRGHKKLLVILKNGMVSTEYRSDPDFTYTTSNYFLVLLALLYLKLLVPQLLISEGQSSRQQMLTSFTRKY